MSRQMIHVNGALLPAEGVHVSAMDRGFTLGDGVFDTIRVIGGRAFRLEDHLDRLQRSAETIGLDLPGMPSGLGDAIDMVMRANRLAGALVRITVSRGVPPDRGVAAPASQSPTVVIAASSFEGYPEERYSAGYRVVASEIRRNPTSPLSRIKSCNYLDAVLARTAAARLGADEAIMLSTRGEVACATSSNVFLVVAGALVTPSLECGILAGVTRKVVMESAARLGITCTERRVLPEEIGGADEIFLTNTAIGIMPVVSLDEVAVGNEFPGPLTRKLREAYEETLRV